MSGACYITIFQPWDFLSLPAKWILKMLYPVMVLFQHAIPCYHVTLNMSCTAILLLSQLSTFHTPLIDCSMKTILITSNIYHIIKFEKECPTRTVLNSATWNINTTGEVRGYRLYSNDIKTFLTFDTEGKLKVCCWTS